MKLKQPPNQPTKKHAHQITSDSKYLCHSHLYLKRYVLVITRCVSISFFSEAIEAVFCFSSKVVNTALSPLSFISGVVFDSDSQTSTTGNVFVSEVLPSPSYVCKTIFALSSNENELIGIISFGFSTPRNMRLKMDGDFSSRFLHQQHFGRKARIHICQF